jgi:hypothetical protein
MTIYLETISVWLANEPPKPSTFFSSLYRILDPSDILVIGSYELDEIALDWFKNHELVENYIMKPYVDDCFDLNREEYPHGKGWIFQASRENLIGLANLMNSLPALPNGFICIDHILAFRAGIPILPIFNYRYAFKGGDLILSGLFSGDLLAEFGNECGISFSQMQNPVLNV